ncbi:unnamed protein product [Pleuronectes platessa]|uniref:Uncharacterized protein n=1 Tax=Pleuronectes platessa TaxID=8262 RepID=A0A9N7VPG2_PLEPL|nr:unnamed protein product [Pleuronectes platessa]
MFSRIPLGVQKTLLHGGGVTSCGTYGHQSGQQVMPPTASSADPSVSEGQQAQAAERLSPLSLHRANGRVRRISFLCLLLTEEQRKMDSLSFISAGVCLYDHWALHKQFPITLWRLLFPNNMHIDGGAADR